MVERTDDFEQVICDCGHTMECIDKPEHPECGMVWYCKDCNTYYYGV